MSDATAACQEYVATHSTGFGTDCAAWFGETQSVSLRDADDYCGTGDGPGTFRRWYFAGPKAGQVWVIADVSNQDVCVDQSLDGTW